MVLLFLYDEVTEEHQKSQWAAHAHDSTNPNSAHFDRCLIVWRVYLSNGVLQIVFNYKENFGYNVFVCLFQDNLVWLKISTYEKINNNVHKVSVCFLKYIYHKQQPILKESVWSTINYSLVKKNPNILDLKFKYFPVSLHIVLRPKEIITVYKWTQPFSSFEYIRCVCSSQLLYATDRESLCDFLSLKKWQQNRFKVCKWTFILFYN